VGEVASSNPGVISKSASADSKNGSLGKGEKFENRLLGPTIYFQLVTGGK
jgi:hypothetical protein